MMKPQALQHVLATLHRILEESHRFAGEASVDLDTDSFTADLSPEHFSALQPIPVARAAAIDGSSSRVLDGLSLVVTVSRAAAVLADQHEVQHTNISDLQATVLSRHSAAETFRNAYRELSDAPPPALPETVEDAAGALRGLREQALARDLIGQLGNGDLCLLDGALHGNRWLQPVIDDTCRMATERHVRLAGVSKRSDLSARGMPLLYWVKRQGDAVLPEQRWWYPLCQERGIYIAKMHPAASYAFRVDIDPLNGRPEQILQQLAALSDDVVTLGYPYPLAAAHRAAVITGEEASYQRRRLRERALHAGVTREDWEGLFYDYHAYLE